MAEQKRRPGRPATGQTPPLNVRVPQHVQDAARATAEVRREKFAAVVERLLTEYVEREAKETRMSDLIGRSVRVQDGFVGEVIEVSDTRAVVNLDTDELAPHSHVTYSVRTPDGWIGDFRREEFEVVENGDR